MKTKILSVKPTTKIRSALPGKPFRNTLKTHILKLTSVGLMLLAGAAVSHAALINLVGNDGLGASSFNSGVNWSGGLAPSAGNDYNTAGYFMRTPGNTTTSYTFGGDSLTLGTNAGASGSMLEKFSSGSGSVRTLTINNFTNLLGAILRSGGTAGALIHIVGNHYTIAGNSGIWGDQCIWVIDAPLLGGDSVILTNFANNSNDHVTYTGTNSGFTGSWYLITSGTSAWSLELDGVTSLPGNPSTFNPGQITFLAGGQLRDTVGCSFTNSNGGITLAANANINASGTTLIGEPITDLTNGVHSLSSLTSSGTGILVLSNANNNYSGGTIISAGTLQLGVANAIPGNTIAGDVTDNGTLDLNGHNATINGLNGSGTVCNTASGTTPTFTIGANGDSGTFSGTIQDPPSETLSLTKIGAGTETLSGGFTYSGDTVVAGGTLSVNSATSVPSSPGNLIISNGAVFAADVSSGTPLPVNNLVVGTNSTLSLTLSGTANGINAAGSLTLQDNATINLNYGSVTANPTALAINVAGGISAPGTNIVINISATGLKSGAFTLIKYGTGTPTLTNLLVFMPPGVAATPGAGSSSIDIHITSTPNDLAWNGVNGTSWDLTTANWTNLLAGGITVFRQYTNGSVIAGDAVLFDDTLANNSTNINLTATYYAFPVVVNSTLPYSIAGAGGIKGVTSLVKSNSGSLTLLTSNSFAGGVFINDSGSVIITNDSALGASSGAVTLNGGPLQINGGVTNSRAFHMPADSTIGVAANITARLAGVISGAGIFNKSDNGTLILAGTETISSNVFLHGGLTIIDSGGSITNTAWDDVGQNGTDSATLTLRGTGSLSTTSDFNVGDLDSSAGTLNISNTATLTANAIFIGSANASGSTASGTVNQSGGTVAELNAGVGEFAIGGRAASASGVGVYNMSGGTLNAAAGIRVGGYGIGTLNQSGGLINALGGINIARMAGSFGTNNLNGGTLSTYNVATSTGTNAVFNFNGGTLQANFSPPSATWMSGGIQANVLAGGAIIDSSNNNVTVSVPLLAGSANGGLTKKGSGTLTLTGVNTFTGPITNNAGTLVLNSASTYPGGAAVNAGTLQMTTASTIQGSTMVSNNAIFTISQVGSATSSLSNLTLNGTATLPGATLGLFPTLANNPAVALVNCGTLTLNGTNTISLPVASVGTIALIRYTNSPGSGYCTNLSLPQGATGYISNSLASSTVYAVITSTGPGIVWTGTNSATGKANLWDINSTTNWLLGATPTSYHQVVVPGDLVTFNDSGSGTVILNTNVAPTSLLISNNSKTYTFSGTGTISGPTSLQKLGSGTAILNLTNTSYGNTVISNGTLQVGNTAAISPAANLVIGPSGTLELAGFNQTAAELTGSGVVDNNSGLDLLLNIGTSSGGTWNGSIQDHGHGGVALIKNGTGTWVVGGNNNLDNGSPFTTTNIFAAGTTIITNGGSFLVPRLQTCIAFGGTATMIVSGGTLAVSNDVLAVGISAGASGTLIVNSGTVVHSGGTMGSFGGANQLIVGDAGGTGTLTVNGGQVLNSQALWLGAGAGASGTLQLNGGLVQASQVTANSSPTTSAANFNGGTLQAATNSADFIPSGTTPLIQSGGLILDDGGFVVSLSSQGLQEDPSSRGGPLIKQGSGAVYLDSGNTYTGTTLVTNGMLAGSGSVAGPVVVAPAGNLGAGDADGTGSFTINNNLTLHGNATMRINKTGGSTAQDQVIVNGNISYGGILTVTNITSDANVLTTNDTFTLFSVTGSHLGNFGFIAGSPGTGLAYSFDPVKGVLSVVGMASNPTNIAVSVSGSTLSLCWPSDHLGWYVQSNSVSVADSSAWYDMPGSQSGTCLNITIGPAQPQVFFRLRRP